LAEDGKSKKASKILKSQVPQNAESGCLPSGCRPFKMFVTHKNYNDLAKDGTNFLAIQRECSICCNSDLEVKNVEDGNDQMLGKI